MAGWDCTHKRAKSRINATCEVASFEWRKSRSIRLKGQNPGYILGSYAHERPHPTATDRPLLVMLPGRAISLLIDPIRFMPESQSEPATIKTKFLGLVD